MLDGVCPNFYEEKMGLTPLKTHAMYERKAMPGIVKALLAIAVFTAFFWAGFRWFEKSNIYYPTRKLRGSPSDAGLTYEDIYFEAGDGTKLHGWFVPADGAEITVLICHGNAGNVSDRIFLLQLLNNIQVNSFIFDYRGYGRSAGTPDEKGLYEDVRAAYRFLVDRDIPPERIVVFGRSLGAAVAASLCLEAVTGGMIFDSGFTSTQDIAAEVYPFLPVRLLMKSHFNSLEKVGRIRVPKLFIHSRNDEMIPFVHAERLFDAAAEPKELFAFRGTHNEAILENGEAYATRLRRFLRECILSEH